MAEQREQTRARIFAQDICRELYDRFAMGGWEPIDAHNWVIEQLQEFAHAPRQSERTLHTLRHFLLCWTVFNSKLPDGEYDGLGELRGAVANLKDLEVELSQPTAQDFCSDMIANLREKVKKVDL